MTAEELLTLHILANGIRSINLPEGRWTEFLGQMGVLDEKGNVDRNKIDWEDFLTLYHDYFDAVDPIRKPYDP